MAPKKSPSFGAEVSFNEELRNCLVNLPVLLVNAISGQAVKIHHVIVEIAWHAPSTGSNVKVQRKVIGAGWTGMPSGRQQMAALDKRGRLAKAREILEIGPAFARENGIVNGQKVCTRDMRPHKARR